MYQKHTCRSLLALALLITLLAALFAGCAGKENTSGTTVEKDTTAATLETAPSESGAAPAESETRDPSVDYDGLATLDVYTVAELPADDARLDDVAAVCAGRELTNRQLQIYYYMQFYGLANQLAQYGMTPESFGLDLSKPLSEQSCPQVSGLNWEQFFLMAALEQFQQMASVNAAADEASFSLPEEDQANLDSSKKNLADEAVKQGYQDLSAYLQDSFGVPVSEEEYYDYLAFYFRVMAYENSLYNSLEYTDEDLLAYFNAHKETDYPNISTDKPNVNVRHILITPEKAEDAKESTEEEWDAAKTKAEELLAEYEKDPTEDKFSALAKDNSTDPGSASNGGLYENVYPGQMVQTFNDWCFDDSRQPGDTGIVKTDYGYHVMYFVSQTEEYYWKTVATQGYVSTRMQTMLDEMAQANPLEADYAKVVIGPIPKGMTTDEE